jgi:hypothetical protein
MCGPVTQRRAAASAPPAHCNQSELAGITERRRAVRAVESLGPRGAVATHERIGEFNTRVLAKRRRERYEASREATRSRTYAGDEAQRLSAVRAVDAIQNTAGNARGPVLMRKRRVELATARFDRDGGRRAATGARFPVPMRGRAPHHRHVFSPVEPPHAPVQLRLHLVQRMQRRVSRGVGGADGMLRC